MNVPATFRLALYAAAILAGVSAAAATTSATINGYVRTIGGDPVPSAQVAIIHSPSGTHATAVTAANGAFHQSGLRVGGPYEIRFSAEGFQDQTLTNVTLTPGPQPPFAAVLLPLGVEEVLATASAVVSARDLNNGVGSAYTAADIAGQPSITRDVIRTLLRDPLAQSAGEGNLSVGGVNPRFNGLAIDGSLQQDDFGLSSGTYATSRSPINLDAVESASLVASDYSVSASGFTGGLVNITTKSGTNEWDGAAFYTFHGNDQVGDTYDGSRSFTPSAFEEKEYGLSVGGPLIANRLFVFLSYDEFEAVQPVDFAAFDSARGIQPGFFEALRGVVRDVYGYDPGGRPASASTPEGSERTLVKLDWNASDAHRASFTYQESLETGTSVGADRLASAWIDIPVELTAYTAQLFSDWSDRVSTTVRSNLKTFTRGQNCRAPGIGALEFDNLEAADVAGTPLAGLLTGSVDLVAGCDRFRHANAYDDERLQLFGALDYLAGDHILRIGGERESFDLFNLFVPGSNGRFVFADFAAIADRRARVDYVNAASNNAADAAAAWGYERTTVFVQDTWQARPDLELTAGLRYERFAQDERPDASPAVASAYGIRTDRNLDGLDLLLPRLSFRWTGMPRTAVSGGVGRFSGGDPKVWTSNAFQVPTVFSRTFATGVSPTSVPAELRAMVAAGRPVAIDAIAPGFEMPSDWKASLRLERDLDLTLGALDLGTGYTLTAQALLTVTADGFLWTNLAQTRLPAAQPTGVAPDGRTIYADLDDLGILNLVTLANHREGSSRILTAALAKRYDMGLDFQVSYAWQDVETVTEGLSSRGISNWRGIADADRNRPSPRTSPHQVTHAVKLNVGYERDFGAFRAHADLFARAWSGDRFTYTFDVDRGNALFGRAGAGESPYDNSPLYVPARPNDAAVVYGSGFDQAAFFAYLDDNDIDAGIHRPYSADAGMNQVWDLRLRLELPRLGLGSRIGDSRASIVLDVENVLNLLNDEWGTYHAGPRFGQAAVVRADLVSAADVAALGVDGAPALTGNAPRTACRQPRDCVFRYNRFRAIAAEFPSAARSVYRIRLGFRFEI
ncbi:MAG: carboxypeptidase regulatory-like domain-containing protein [Gammaproteobacteria bacterium]|nr:carboxypeptidase regulatory-like domain-containing protein [Gammaproteobacteria bacterium]